MIFWSNEKKSRGEKKDGRDFQDSKEDNLSSTGVMDQKTLRDSYETKSIFRQLSSVFVGSYLLWMVFHRLLHRLYAKLG